MEKVFLYAGQGSQRVGMGKDFYEEYESFRSFIDQAAASIKEFDLKKMMFEGPIEELSKTEYTQACMAAFAAGITILLNEASIHPQACCGLSLGEYGALYAAGVFSAEDYVKLVAFRGKAMMEAAKGYECSMSAILALDSDLIREACENYMENAEDFVTVANYNCPGQTVICGDESAVTKLEAILKEKGAKRCIRLNVSGPFHTKYMAAAGEALKKYFKSVSFSRAEIPVACNATGEFLGDLDVKELLIRQVQSSVYLEKDLIALLEAGYSDFVEIGPGNTMAGFLKKTAKALGKKANVVSIDSVADFKKLVEA